MPHDDLWRRVYESPWHNPGFFWLCGALFFLAMGLQQGGLRGFLLIFGFTTLADCTLTGGWSPIPPDAWVGTLAAVVFVILGDLRYLLLAEALRTGEGLGRVALQRAVPLSLLIPVATFGLRSLLPSVFTAPRPFFLLYEVLFFVLALGHGLFSLRRLREEEASLFRSLLTFELVQYGLWATADVVLLAGVSAGNLLRLVPNAMYYAFFLPFVWKRADGARGLS